MVVGVSPVETLTKEVFTLSEEIDLDMLCQGLLKVFLNNVTLRVVDEVINVDANMQWRLSRDDFTGEEAW